MPDTSFHPVILSGGSGTRLWPLSRKGYPKQFLALGGETSLLQQTATRLAAVPGAVAPMVIANDAHRFMVRQQLEEAGITGAAIVLEPIARNTAPAVALACLSVLRAAGDAVMGIFPSDHLIRDEAAFGIALSRAVAGAEAGRIVTFSIAATRPETGYGYIRHGTPLPGLDGVDTVDAFIEKPNRTTAEGYLAQGGYGWNSGMFVFRADVMRDALAAHAPDVLTAAEAALDAADNDIGFVRISEHAFSEAPSVSIDVAVLEKTDLAATVAADMAWSDLGAWTAIREIDSPDSEGNTVRGRTVVRETRNSHIQAEDGTVVAALGLENTVVVATKDAVLVAAADRIDAVRDLVADLESGGHGEAETHRTVARPWGTYEDIDREDNFRVKRIVVRPGARLSLQRHRHRSEHWVVVRGTAHVTVGDEVQVLTRNQSTYVPIGATHRLENKGPEPLHLIEVQVGDYVEEDDIERLEDVYGRTE